MPNKTKLLRREEHELVDAYLHEVPRVTGRSLATRYGLSHQGVYNVLRRYGAAVRTDARPHKVFTKREQQDICVMVRAGRSKGYICGRLSLTPHTVARFVSEQGLTFTPVSKCARHHDTILALLTEGKSVAAVARHIGVRQPTLDKYIRRNKLLKKHMRAYHLQHRFTRSPKVRSTRSS